MLSSDGVMVHRTLGPRLTASIALIGGALAVSPAFGFCRTTTCAVLKPPPSCVRDAQGCLAAGIPLQWPQQCLSFSVNQAGSAKLGLDYAAALDLVQRGFGLWPSAMCADGGFPSIAVTSLGPLICDQHEYNPLGPNANAILFRDQGWTHDPQAIALTSVTFNARTGQILDADMEINSGGFPLSPQDLEYVFAHESGHFFGLDHSPDQSAVMYFEYAVGNTSDAKLTPDDVAAICTAYPTGRMTPACDFQPPDGFATDCGGNVLAACAVAPGPPSARRSGGAAAALLLGIAVASLRGWRRYGHRRRAAKAAAGQASQPGSRPRSP
jgi:hypothetical protein